MARVTIIVTLPETDTKQAVLVKELVDKALEKIPGVETELNIRGK